MLVEEGDVDRQGEEIMIVHELGEERVYPLVRFVHGSGGCV
jgi:hypothetical protein